MVKSKSQSTGKNGKWMTAILYPGKGSPGRWYLSRGLKEGSYRKGKGKVIKMNEGQVSLIILGVLKFWINSIHMLS